MGSILGRGSKIPHAMLLSQKKKQKTKNNKPNKNQEKEHKCHNFEIVWLGWSRLRAGTPLKGLFKQSHWCSQCGWTEDIYSGDIYSGSRDS